MSIDRRREPRTQGGGSVVLLAEQPFRRWIEGSLLDMSRSGFRMSHRDGELEVGNSVEFWIGDRRGEARVIWHRIVADRIESGFVVWVDGGEAEAC
jgi:hypothetical protein